METDGRDIFAESVMDLFHCISSVSSQKFQAGETEGSRAKSEERQRGETDPVAPPRGMRRASLHSSARKLSASK